MLDLHERVSHLLCLHEKTALLARSSVPSRFAVEEGLGQ